MIGDVEVMKTVIFLLAFLLLLGGCIRLNDYTTEKYLTEEIVARNTLQISVLKYVCESNEMTFSGYEFTSPLNDLRATVSCRSNEILKRFTFSKEGLVQITISNLTETR
jgi:Tfp pilus assembly protein PilP